LVVTALVSAAWIGGAQIAAGAAPPEPPEPLDPPEPPLLPVPPLEVDVGDEPPDPPLPVALVDVGCEGSDPHAASVTPSDDTTSNEAQRTIMSAISGRDCAPRRALATARTAQIPRRPCV
jgi:hypothetical protein